MQSIEINGFNHFKTPQAFRLKPLTLIDGDNGSGKTTILQALELGLTGGIYDPTSGKSAELLGFFNHDSDEMKITMDFGKDDYLVERSFVRKESEGKWSIAENLTVHPVPIDANNDPIEGLTNLKKWFAEQLGSILQFDFRDFVTMSSAKKFEYLFRMFATTELTADELEDRFVDPHLGSVDKKIMDRLINDQNRKLTGLHLINDVMKRLSDFKKDKNAAFQAGKKVVKKLNEIMSELEIIGTNIESLNEEKQRLTKDVQEKKELIRESKQIRSEIETLDNDLNQNLTPEMERLDNELKARKDELQDFINNHNTDEGLDINIQEKEKVYNSISDALMIARESLRGSNANLRNAEIDYNLAMQEKGKTDLIATFIIQIKEHGFCPCCGEEQNPAGDYPIHDLLREKKEFIKSATEERDKWAKSVETFSKSIEVLTEDGVKVQKEINALKSMKVQLADLFEKVSRAEKEHKNHLIIFDNAQNRVIELSDLLKRKSMDDQIIEQQITAIDLRLVQIQDDIDGKNREQGILMAAQRSLKDRDEAEADLKMITKIEKDLTKLKSEEIETAFGSLQEKVSRVFQTLNGTDKSIMFKYQDDRGNVAFKLGTIPELNKSLTSDCFIDFQDENEATRLKILIAFIACLPKDSFRMMAFDNIEKVSASKMPQFIEGLYNELIIKKRMQTVILTSSRGFEMPIEAKGKIQKIKAEKINL